jgi:hypothetical protein
MMDLSLLHRGEMANGRKENPAFLVRYLWSKQAIGKKGLMHI